MLITTNKFNHSMDIQFIVIYSSPFDKALCFWYFKHNRQLQVSNGHTLGVCVVIGGNGYTICFESYDKTIRIWDIETIKQLNIYKDIKIVVHLWDIRPNKDQLFMIKGDAGDDEIRCLKFIELKKKDKTKDVKYDLNLCYGSLKGLIRIWG
ncbi:RIO1 family [Reticulomyxa filosa]|uniref:RIO1 family n=1 Tax=Reticulomyxa filosa TaxID=46433 RepID=X6PBS4_RETFI|nr:RIO1 family [Reticulomyxa filosa]|eukprot:ETO35950.1 RIO1 family [Reticulomyxa filosa]